MTIPGKIFDKRYKSLSPNAARLLIECYRLLQPGHTIIELRRSRMSYPLNVNTFYKVRRELLSLGYLRKIRKQNKSAYLQSYVEVVDANA